MINDYLSKNNTKSLKGIFAIFVLMHHLFQYSAIIHDAVIGSIFQSMGYLSVGMFFFLSGYGLFKSYYKSREVYLKSFPTKKILTFYIDILLFTIIYILLDIFISPQSITFIGILKSLTFGGTIIANGWYLQVALLLYICFYFIFKYVKNENYKIIVSFISIILIVLVMYILKMPLIWYEGLLAFPFGMLYAKYDVYVDKRINTKSNILLFIMSFTAFSCTYIGDHLIKNDLHIVTKLLSILFFIILVICIIRWIPVSTKITVFLGEISLEIYVLQGLFLWILRLEVVSSMVWTIRLIISIAIFLTTIAFSALIHPFIKNINSLISNKFQRS